jgi:TadE-like protein
MVIKTKRLLSHLKQANKGQSFVELAIVLLFLLMLLVGMVEFGNLLNTYIGLVDGAREGARFGSNSDPFGPAAPGCGAFESCIDLVVEGAGVPGNAGALSPIVLDPTTDDVIISYFTIIQGPPISLVRFPTQNGHNYWCKYCDTGQAHPHSSQITNAQVLSEVDSRSPSTGVLVVEVFYAYHQLLNLPGIANFVPNPIPVNTYAIFPLSAAEPTATP